MSKIICEVCGTAYPEASTQCPICGCVRPADAQGIPSSTVETAPERTYQHVKGGRFSKANVRKRTTSSQNGAYEKADKPARASAPSHPKQSSHKQKKQSGNMGLVITIFVLLLAIIAVVAYILIKFFIPTSSKLEVTEPTESAVIIEPSDVVDETPGDIYCQELSLDAYELNLESAGDYTYLTAILTPFDTTEEVIFESADSSVAMAEPDGRIVAVRKGETFVTVTCGIVSAQCKVTVGIPKIVFELDSQEVTLMAPGESVFIYTGEIPADEISWSSDDNSVATVSAGVVTAVGSGSTTVYGDYNGETQSCVIYCEFAEATDPVTTEDDEPENVEAEATEPAETQAPSSEYKAPFALKNLIGPNSQEVSLYVGDSFSLALVDSNGTHIKGVSWTVEGSCCTVSDGTVKALRSGNCVIVATYGGETYECRIIVW